MTQFPWRACAKCSSSVRRRLHEKLLDRPVKVASYHPDANNYETVMQVVCREVHTTFKRR